MADLPENPNNREEEYLADIAGENGTKPDNPWSRKEAYLDAIDGRIDGMEEQIAALATDLSFKGSVESEADLPTGAATGDTYITEDTGVMYVWTGDDWVALGGTGINVVQTTGTSTTDVMSQNATSRLLFPDETNHSVVAINAVNAGINSSVTILGDNTTGGYNNVCIGNSSRTSSFNSVAIGIQAKGSGRDTVAIGSTTNSNARAAITVGASANATSERAIAIGENARAAYKGSIALGSNSTTAHIGEINVSTSSSDQGYNGSSTYRLLTGLYDPQNDHDAATKGYVDSKNLVFYMSVDPAVTANQVSVYSDASCTTPISLRTFFSALRDGKSVCLQYRDGSGEEDHLSSFQIVTSRLTNVDTEDAYNEVSPYAIYYVGSGWKRIGADAVDPDATTGAFNIASQS